jgi:dTDP-4-dehydrorhamnose 3,5-epimerase
VSSAGLFIEVEAFFINMPTRAYDHADPDKYRVPVKNALIPFAFDDGPGW